MTSTKQYIEQKLNEIYDTKIINDSMCFVVNSSFVKIGSFADIIVAEYADNLEDAYNNVFEDGDAFSVEMYSDEEILKLILKEMQ